MLTDSGALKIIGGINLFDSKTKAIEESTNALIIRSVPLVRYVSSANTALPQSTVNRSSRQNWPRFDPKPRHMHYRQEQPYPASS